MDSNGVYTYTPNADFNGTDMFTYSLCDDGTPNLCDTATVTITVNAVNDPPVIGQPPIVLPEDDDSTFCPTITDIDTGDSLTLSICGGPANGTATNDSGCITYTPNPDFNGEDSICLLVCDNGSPVLCDTIMVPITVTPVNDYPEAEDDYATTDEDVSVIVDVQANDFDLDGDTLTTTIIIPPSQGTAVVNPDGTITYTPSPNTYGFDTLVYVVCDTEGYCDTATVFVTVNPVNDAPVANDITTSTAENTPVGVNVSSATSDPENDPLDYNYDTSGLPPGTGFTETGNGSIIVTPPSGFTGVITIPYTVCDTSPYMVNVLCASAVIIINVIDTVDGVNNPPFASDDQAVTVMDSPGIIINPLANDNDPNGDPLTVTILGGPSNGTATVNPNGTVSYTPDSSFTGVDTILYIACDPSGACDTAYIIITVFPQEDYSNQPPVAVDDFGNTDEDTPVTIGVPTNDSDPNGDPLTLPAVISGPSNGTAVVNPDGTITYTPNTNYNGFDTLVYVICDGDGVCDTATVIITINSVNDPPVAVDDSYTTPEDSQLTFDSELNDSDVEGPISDPTIIDGPNNGTAVVNGDGTITYTPDAGFNGSDTIIYVICDTGNPVLCDTAIIIITVDPINDAPIAIDDETVTDEDTPVIIDVLMNDSDPDGDTLSNPFIIDDPDHGTATVNPDGTITYTPDPDYYGTDTFVYIICDENDLCDTAVVVITINPVDDPPVISGDPQTTPEDQYIIFCLPYLVEDPSDTLSVSILCGPENGTVDSIWISDGTVCISYTPNLNYNGPDSVCVILCDESTGLCDTVVIQITVTPMTEPCWWIKGFSPNGNGQNDIFFINCNENYPDATLKVFNRWGDEVWRSNGHYENNWDGNNMAGEVLPDGTYYDIYEMNDGSGETHASFVVINR